MERGDARKARLEREARDVIRPAVSKAFRARLAEAWDEGLSAGRERWADAREFGDPPINPYRADIEDEA